MDNKKYAKEMMAFTLKGMKSARDTVNMKDYRTLSNSLKELHYVLSHQITRQGFKVSDISDLTVLVDLLDKELEILTKVSRNFLSGNKVVEYHDTIVSFGKIEMIKNKLKDLTNDINRGIERLSVTGVLNGTKQKKMALLDIGREETYYKELDVTTGDLVYKAVVKGEIDEQVNGICGLLTRNNVTKLIGTKIGRPVAIETAFEEKIRDNSFRYGFKVDELGYIKKLN